MLRQLSTLLLAACATATAEQVILSSDSESGQQSSGVLRRFNVPHGQAEGLLAYAQVRLNVYDM